MSKRKKKIYKKRKFPDKKLIFSIGIIAVVVGGLVYYKVFFRNPEIHFSLEAAIIDQLGKGLTQNPEFNSTVTNLLVNAGFNVSYHKSESITVDFYKGLAKKNYGLIVLRSHTALREDRTTVDVFTSENYTEALANLYRAKYGTGVLVRGEYLWERGKFYFAITTKFIENLDGYFPKSIIIAMGCWSLKSEIEESKSMAAAFINKGAKAYVGWTDAVYPDDTDAETVKLLNMLLIEKKTLGDAISNTSTYTCTIDSQTVTTRLDFYPKSAANLTISELINEAKASMTLQSTVYNFEPLLPLICATNVLSYKSKDLNLQSRLKR